jgi:ketosteroid isomerase-like protein
MTHKVSIVLTAPLAALAMTVCTQGASASPLQTKISDAEAASAADAAQVAWASMDAGKIDSVYAPNIVGFDPVAPPLSTDRGNWTKLQQGFAAMKFDHVDVTGRTIQVLDGNNFVVSGVANFTSKDGPLKAMPMRFTDVYERQPNGKFLIVNEHVSQVPAPPK